MYVVKLFYKWILANVISLEDVPDPWHDEVSKLFEFVDTK